jgi:fumarate hydratase class II
VSCACRPAALYGATTQRAVENFPVSGLPMPRAFLRALGLVKAAAAEANGALGPAAGGDGGGDLGRGARSRGGRHDAQFPSTCSRPARALRAT